MVIFSVKMDLDESLSDSKLEMESDSKKVLKSTISLSMSEPNTVDHVTSSDHLKQYKHWVTADRWNELKLISETAMKDRRVFTIKGGGYPAVRSALIDRGWVEKPDPHRMKKTNPFAPDAKKWCKKDPFTRVEKMIVYKFMEQHSVDFLWTSKRDKYDWLLSNKDVIISRSIFTSKEGLCGLLQEMHWYTEPGVAYTRFPRCYNIHNSEHLEDFIDDFRNTACIGLLKWFTKSLQDKGEPGIVDPSGKVPHTAVEFAIGRLEEFIVFLTHKDIDAAEDDSQHIWEHEWDLFLTHHYMLVHESAKLTEDKGAHLKTLYRKSVKVLTTISKFWPQMEIDGIMNIWIVKPGNKCRGKGIQLMNNIKDIVGLINLPNTQKTRYVVQKYIENPLTIYDTKFDIRQWFLITNCQPLTIWMYKDSYLRFSSQIFSLSNYHESVHLTNNAVQSRYKNNGERNKALPDENMWDCHSFKAYLRQVGKADLWDERIYPGMKQCLIGAMLACQESMDKRQNSFELYGADFMLTTDYTPWLIEINSSPDLAPTTSVTARMCPKCLHDVIKVVIDKRTNSDADSGLFELIYKQVIPKPPAYLGLSLSINGKKLVQKMKSAFPTEKRYEKLKMPNLHKLSYVSREKTKRESDLPVPSSYDGPIITDLINWLNPYESFRSEHFTVRHSLNVVKPGLLIKIQNNKKTKPKTNNRRVKTAIRRVCYTPPHKEVKEISVGNKRCYIDPAEWEKTSGIITRATESFQNKIECKRDPKLRVCTSSINFDKTSDILSTSSVQISFNSKTKSLFSK